MPLSFSKFRASILAVVALLIGCAPPTSNVEIPVAVYYGSEPIDCSTMGSGTALSDFRVFLYDVTLRDGAGESVAAIIEELPPWQSTDVALIDLEDGSGACENGSAAMNASLRFDIPEGQYSGISFRLGVPESLNHGDPLTASAPLNIIPMHWHWTTGYKFLRAGIRTEHDGFWMHLGSTRCNGTVTNIEGCDAANRASINLPEFDPARDVIVFDLEMLTEAVNMTDGEHSSCSSGPAETACQGPFSALGIDFASGVELQPATFVRAEQKR